MACSQPSGNGPKLFELVCVGFGAKEATKQEKKKNKTKKKTRKREGRERKTKKQRREENGKKNKITDQ